jgi:hypothetical protein
MEYAGLQTRRKLRRSENRTDILHRKTGLTAMDKFGVPGMLSGRCFDTTSERCHCTLVPF